MSASNNSAETAAVVVADGRVTVRGAMTFATVNALFEQSRDAWRPGSGSITIDLHDVAHADSAGVALLVEWFRLADTAGRTVTLANTPDQVERLIKVSGLSHLLH